MIICFFCCCCFSFILEDYGWWSLNYGYLDGKPSYFTNMQSEGEIHFKFEITDANLLWICGTVKESFLRVPFYVDLNVPNFDQLNNLTEYIPSKNRVQWDKKRYLFGECKELFDLPVGKHILSLASHHNHTVSVTHLIKFSRR